MSNRKSAYPPEFRAEAIQLVRTSGKSQTVIARELGMSVETLRLWLKQAEDCHRGWTSARAARVARVRR